MQESSVDHASAASAATMAGERPEDKGKGMTESCTGGGTGERPDERTDERTEESALAVNTPPNNSPAGDPIPTTRPRTAEGILNDSSSKQQQHPKSMREALNARINTCGALATLAAFIIAIPGTILLFRGYEMTRWQQMHDFRNNCRNDKVLKMILSEACEKVLLVDLGPPPYALLPNLTGLTKRSVAAASELPRAASASLSVRLLHVARSSMSWVAVGLHLLEKFVSFCFHPWTFDYALIVLSLALYFRYRSISKVQCITCLAIPTLNQLILWPFWCQDCQSLLWRAIVLLPDSMCFVFIFAPGSFNELQFALKRVLHPILSSIWVNQTHNRHSFNRRSFNPVDGRRTFDQMYPMVAAPSSRDFNSMYPMTGTQSAVAIDLRYRHRENNLGVGRSLTLVLVIFAVAVLLAIRSSYVSSVPAVLGDTLVTVNSLFTHTFPAMLITYWFW